MTDILTIALLVLQFLKLDTTAEILKSHPTQQTNTKDHITIKILSSDSTTQQLLLSKAEIIGQERDWEPIARSAENPIPTYSFATNSPHYLSLESLSSRFKYRALLLEPGDNITFHVTPEKVAATGKGAIKFELLEKIDQFQKSIPLPNNTRDYITTSIDDYYEWDAYLNKLVAGKDSILSHYQAKLSKYSYTLLRALMIDQNIDDRSDKFYNLVFGLAKTQKIPGKILCKIYDSLYYPATNSRFQFCSTIIYGNWKPILFSIHRTYNFNRTDSTYQAKYNTWITCYQKGIDHYVGLNKEQFIIDFLYKHLLKEFGFTKELETYLKDYYSSSQSEECKQYLKSKESRLRRIINGRKIPDFDLEDPNGNTVTNTILKDKIGIIEYWFTGCAGCIQTAKTIQKAEDHFRDDTNVVFLKVSIDGNKSTWQQSIKKGQYTSPTGIHLFTQGQQENHQFITQMDVTSYPTLQFIDPFGQLLTPTMRPASLKSNPDSLIQYISTIRQNQFDGPYLYEQGNSKLLKITRNQHQIDSQIITSDEDVSVATDQLKKVFSFRVANNVKKQPSYYKNPTSIFALSDIEGNFAAFRKLLVANHIIDTNLNWSFGNGHFVICGDVFDRGEQVTECLWLIYKLELQAIEMGGYVHFIMGNHDVMNLQGNSRYAQKKYTQTANDLKSQGITLYPPHSILGKWLRTKNIVEQIDSLIFVHGGLGIEFTSEVANSNLDEINNQYRQSIGTKWNDLPKSDTLSRAIFHPATGPLWYRQYYTDSERLQLGNDTTTKFTVQKPSQEHFDRLLKKWKASKIITGHTIVSDTVSSHYNNKLINIDTKHSAGNSEALLIEGNKYYRVNNLGERIPLFKAY
ncbi:metallophosphoesterase [Paraflavitalea pollutisoli]|uniref:metallophosphoesterase n=1 Tax=Paraflavitalea pollutisoli TaxID=3034143 RepID=UPI0023ED611B|nr:metallophosphoesterase [Paraflavitalea sp. H1-2-19X]